RSLRDALLRPHKPEEELCLLQEALRRTGRSSSLDQVPAENDEAEGTPAKAVPQPGPDSALAALEAARAGLHVLPSSAASAIRAIRAARPADESEQVDLILGSIG